MNSIKKKTRKIDNDKFCLLIIGGSQGASIFDKNLKKSILNLSKKFSIKIIQQTHLNNISSAIFKIGALECNAPKLSSGSSQ